MWRVWPNRRTGLDGVMYNEVLVLPVLEKATIVGFVDTWLKLLQQSTQHSAVSSKVQARKGLTYFAGSANGS